MKQLYYDLKKNSWYHTYASIEEQISLGRYFIVPYKDYHAKDYLSFPYFLHENKAGPLIGILASPKKEGFIGNIGLFKRIQKALHQTGGNSIVFTPNQLSDNGVSGFCYLPNHDHWIKMEAPLPDIIYNRLYTFEDEDKYLEPIQNIASLYQIPVLNPCFFDKWELYLQLRNHEKLTSHLPDTALLNEEVLEEFLTKYNTVYVKKRKSNKGNGIAFIRRNGHTFLLKTTSTKTLLFPNINKLTQYFKKQGPLFSFIVQEAISTVPLHGKKFDYRILSHRKNNRFSITGVGVRVANTQQVTTHVPSGGAIASLEDTPIPLDTSKLEQMIKQCGIQLQSFYETIGEFSADIGVTNEGNYYIFELNAKPMDFDEPSIKRTSTKALIELFYEMTNHISIASLHQETAMIVKN
ncbi:YheC/YheD family endospore coat-associated protein [Sutcliffiella deserti]|uniref:YheC/YheD family endospore coat-associated protein n=1 Tax=Sutcliffiella deserti TaxID=2875501 RepID=UPI001CBB308C|nr:YheC/YheD family protein [Sutcliffiella deserti]